MEVACDTGGAVTIAEFLLILVLTLPFVLGAVAAYLLRPWWWAAVIAVVLALIVLIAPTPEPGEPRLAVEDLGFVAVVCLVVTALTWLGGLLGRRLARRPHR